MKVTAIITGDLIYNVKVYTQSSTVTEAKRIHKSKIEKTNKYNMVLTFHS